MDSNTATSNVADTSSEMCMEAKPVEQHQWLQQLVGEWTMQGEAFMGPDQPPLQSSGKESVRSVGGLWIVAEGEGEMPGGGQAQMIMTLGYDPAKGHFVGSWIGSMMTLMWVYSGELQADGKTLVLSAVGPDMTPGAAPGKQANYHDIIELVDANTRILRSEMQGEDGTWTQFMKAVYTRVG